MEGNGREKYQRARVIILRHYQHARVGGRPMMTGTITDDQARALATLIATLRPGWDIAGIRTALHQARHRASAHDLAIAAIRCTLGDARTPAVIALDGPHWLAVTPGTSTTDRLTPHCPTHGQRVRVTDGCCPGCIADDLAPDYPGPSEPPGLTPAQIATNTVGLATLRAALTERTDP